MEEARINLATDAQRERLRTLAAKLELIDTVASSDASLRDVSLPKKDRPILLAALAARATHLITGDVRHFGPFFGESVHGIVILSPAEYLKIAAGR